MDQVRGIRTETREWVTGYYAGEFNETAYIITDFRPDAVISIPVVKDSLGRITGKYDSENHPLYEGDLIISLANGTELEILFGEYEAYCPADKMYMSNVGFYASATKYDMPDMPLGPTEEYALLVGDVYSRKNEEEVDEDE